MTKEPLSDWKVEYRKRFCEKRELSDGTSCEYIHLKGSALDKDLQDFIENLLESKKKEIGERIGKHNKIIKERLDYCLEQNGMPHCKNCGLNGEDDIIALEDIKEVLIKSK